MPIQEGNFGSGEAGALDLPPAAKSLSEIVKDMSVMYLNIALDIGSTRFRWNLAMSLNTHANVLFSSLPKNLNMRSVPRW
jgi:hypothetical protein